MSKFNLPSKLRKSFQQKINEQGGIGNLPDVHDWINEPVDLLFNTGSVQLGWAEQDDTDNMELVTFTNLKEHEMFEGRLPDNVAFIRCENQNDEFTHIIVGPGENGFEVHMMRTEDNVDFTGRVLFHTQEMGLLDQIVMHLAA